MFLTNSLKLTQIRTKSQFLLAGMIAHLFFFVFLSSSKDGKYVDARRICVEKMKMTHW